MFIEYGVNNASYFPMGYQEIYQHILEYTTAHDISYSAFAWSVEKDAYRANAFPAVIKDWNGTPLNGGVYTQDDILAPSAHQ